MADRVTKTERTELVETHNLVLALSRLAAINDYRGASEPWKRAMYHALCMSGSATSNTLAKIREALELP